MWFGIFKIWNIIRLELDTLEISVKQCKWMTVVWSTRIAISEGILQWVALACNCTLFHRGLIPWLHWFKKLGKEWFGVQWCPLTVALLNVLLTQRRKTKIVFSCDTVCHVLLPETKGWLWLTDKNVGKHASGWRALLVIMCSQKRLLVL